jgi:hypothetical protein
VEVRAAVEARVEAEDYTQVDGLLRGNARQSCLKRVEQVERHAQQ